MAETLKVLMLYEHKAFNNTTNYYHKLFIIIHSVFIYSRSSALAGIYYQMYATALSQLIIRNR